MQMLYNSEQFAVVQIDLDEDPRVAGAGDALSLLAQDGGTLRRGGYEIVDKIAGRELFIEGALADEFRTGALALIRRSPSTEEIDDWLGRYQALALQPLVLH